MLDYHYTCTIITLIRGIILEAGVKSLGWTDTLPVLLITYRHWTFSGLEKCVSVWKNVQVEKKDKWSTSKERNYDLC